MKCPSVIFGAFVVFVVAIVIYVQQLQATGSTKYEAGYAFRVCAKCPEMVVLPAGSLAMGSPRGEEGRQSSEGPQRRVKVPNDFAIGKFEVTFDQWQACLDGGRCGGVRPMDELVVASADGRALMFEASRAAESRE